MKVKDLIEQLSKFDLDEEVFVGVDKRYCSNSYGLSTCQGVFLDKNLPRKGNFLDNDDKGNYVYEANGKRVVVLGQTTF